MCTPPFIPDGFESTTSLVTADFRLESLGPSHNDADLVRHAADFAARTVCTMRPGRHGG